MEYKFEVTQRGYGYITVEADDCDQAYDKAWQEYYSKNVTWVDYDYDVDLVDGYGE